MDFDFRSLQRKTAFIATECGPSVGYGSGTPVYSDGEKSLVLTCGHNVDFVGEGQHIWVQLEGDNPQKAVVLSDQSYFEEDLALLGTWCGKRRECLDLSPMSLVEKDTVVHLSSFSGGVGSLSNASGTITQPLIDGRTYDEDCTVSHYVEFELKCDSGSSGAALVDSSQALVAVNVTSNAVSVNVPDKEKYWKDIGLQVPGNLHFGIPAGVVYKMIRDMSVVFEESATVMERLEHIANEWEPDDMP